MTPCPYRVSAETPLAEAISTMSLRSIRHLPVISEDGTIIGVVSERDVKIANSICDTTGFCPSVADIVNEEPLVVQDDEHVAAVAARMLEKRADCVLVSDSSGNITGIFTSTDALRVIQIYAGEVK